MLNVYIMDEILQIYTVIIVSIFNSMNIIVFLKKTIF